MVYCGKASLGCQNCRTRRIKCDKVRPECSQCIRVGKKCSGYRDQLSLMFRDESTKVMQKAHAQWGGDPGEGSSSSRLDSTGPASSSGLSPASSSSSSSDGGSPATSSSSQVIVKRERMGSVEPRFSQLPHPSQILARARRRGGPRDGSPTSVAGMMSLFPIVANPNPLARIDPTMKEKGLKFFIDHFVLGLPDEPADTSELGPTSWVFQDNLQQSMAAVGLAAISNLSTSPETGAVAHRMYGLGLQDMREALLAAQTTPIQTLIRMVLTLAMFEIVRGTDPDMGSGARTHVVGAAAILRSLYPVRDAAAAGIRGLLQLCYSLLLSCVVADCPLPAAFSDWVMLAHKAMPDEERPSTELLPVVADLVERARRLRIITLMDGSEETSEMLMRLLSIDDTMEAWEACVNGKWEYRVCHGDFDRRAFFRGQYHVYTDNWTSRIWNHYRWSRLLVSSVLLEFSRQHPATCASVAARRGVAMPGEAVLLATIERMAEGILISVPSHWTHPSLTPQERELVRCKGGAGTGMSGIPGLLFHVDVAASAPGVPTEFTDWALDFFHSVWAATGMVQAKSLRDGLLRHRDRSKASFMDGVGASVIAPRHFPRLKIEEIDGSGDDDLDDTPTRAEDVVY